MIQRLLRRLCFLQRGSSRHFDLLQAVSPRSGGRGATLTAAVLLALTLSGCGGSAASAPDLALPAVDGPEDSLALNLYRTPAPIVDLGDILHVGADVAPPARGLVATGMHDEVAVSSGRVRDGVGAADVLAYLNQIMNPGEYKVVAGLETFSAPPTVRVAADTNAQFLEYALGAVRLINAALPQGKRILFSRDPAPPLAAIEDVPDGEIFIDFARWADWNVPSKPPRDVALGLCSCASNQRFDETTGQRTIQERRAAHVWVERDKILTARVLDPETMKWETRVLDSHENDGETLRMSYSAQGVVAILVHEILHAMGMTHVDPGRFPNSMMSNAGSDEDPDGVTGHVLYPVDREALLAAYSGFSPGTLPGRRRQTTDVSGVLDGSNNQVTLDGALGGNPYSGLLPEDLGPWEDTSFHLRGDLGGTGGSVSFGVASRNGLVQAWASGPVPQTDLADNPSLSETATWSGRLLGLTDTFETVGGAVSLRVQLETLDAQLDMTGLEHWGAHVAPGPVGTGTTWGDGGLQYTMAIRGNTFLRTGGDEGMVTGVFFGPAHEAMGGVVERTDLTAGFGGVR